MSDYFQEAVQTYKEEIEFQYARAIANGAKDPIIELLLAGDRHFENRGHRVAVWERAEVVERLNRPAFPPVCDEPLAEAGRKSLEDQFENARLQMARDALCLMESPDPTRPITVVVIEEGQPADAPVAIFKFPAGPI